MNEKRGKAQHQTAGINGGGKKKGGGGRTPQQERAKHAESGRNCLKKTWNYSDGWKITAMKGDDN